MSQAGSYLLNMIHERTKLKPLPTINAKNYDIWVKAWFETAEEMIQEFKAEGLQVTANALELEIEWQRQRYAGLVERLHGTDAERTYPFSKLKSFNT